MHPDWFKGARGDADRKARSAEIVAGERAISHLRDLVKLRITATVDAIAAKARYENPNWPYEQAGLTSQLRVYRELLQLLSLTEDDECLDCLTNPLVEASNSNSPAARPRRRLWKSLKLHVTSWARGRSTLLWKKR
jgi:hypothetical protein